MKLNQNTCQKTTFLFTFLFVLALSAQAQFTLVGSNLYVTNTSNKLGIGTTAPATKLHVAGSGSIARIASSTGTGYLNFYSYTTTNVGYAGIYDGSTSIDFGTSAGNTSGRVNLVTQATPRLTVATNGWVGIGTTAPLARFQVIETTNFRTALFNNSAAATDNTVVLEANTSGTGGGNATALKGVSVTGPFSGTGGYFEGGLYSGRFAKGEVFSRAKNTIHSLHVESDSAEAIFVNANRGHGLLVNSTNPPGVTGYYAGFFNGNVFTTGVYTSSDARLKQDVAPLRNALERISMLKPSTYHYKTGDYSMLNLPQGEQMGLIAQELEKVFPELVGDVKADEHHCGEHGNSGEHLESITFKAVNYTGLIPVLIAGIQEQQAELESKDKKINALEDRISRLERIVASLADRSVIPEEKPVLEETTDYQTLGNRPNPFQATTLVTFELATEVRSAVLQIFDPSGRLIRRLKLEDRGKSQIEVNLNGLPAGTYTYTIVADGQTFPAQKMTLVGSK